MIAWTQAEIDKCIEDCKLKSITDKDFRAQLLADPAAAIKRICGKDIPPGVRLKIVEADPAFDATFVLPPMTHSEVSDEKLDDMAGGGLFCLMEVCAMEACAVDK